MFSKHRITTFEKRLIIQANNYFKNETTEGRELHQRSARQRVAECLGFAPSTVAGVVAHWNAHQDPDFGDTSDADSDDDTPPPVFYGKEIRDYVHACNLRSEPCTSKKVQLHLQELTGVAISARSVRNWLRLLDFRFVKGAKRSHLAESKGVKALRRRYITMKVKNRTPKGYPRLPEVFLDESYVNENHTSEKTWLAPGEDRVSASGVGPRFVIVGAGVVFMKNGSLHGEWVEDSLQLWQSDRKHDHEDYHGNFTAPTFEAWFEKLCIKLKEVYGPTLIHMDRASYHLRCLNPHPNTSWKRAAITEWLDSRFIYYAPKTPIRLLLPLCDMHREEKRYRSFEIAEAHGHKVRLTPPYHPEVQPIELIWARVKNVIALEAHVSMTKLKIKLLDEFRKIRKIDWVRAYKHAQKFEDVYNELPPEEGESDDIPVDEPLEDGERDRAHSDWVEIWTL